MKRERREGVKIWGVKGHVLAPLVRGRKRETSPEAREKAYKTRPGEEKKGEGTVTLSGFLAREPPEKNWKQKKEMGGIKKREQRENEDLIRYCGVFDKHERRKEEGEVGIGNLLTLLGSKGTN